MSSYAGETGTFRLVKAGNLINSHNCKALKQDVNPLNREVTPYFQTTVLFTLQELVIEIYMG